jgi:hypothetical protein
MKLAQIEKNLQKLMKSIAKESFTYESPLRNSTQVSATCLPQVCLKQINW